MTVSSEQPFATKHGLNGTSSKTRVSSEKTGNAVFKGRSQQRLNFSMTVCPDILFELMRFVTKLHPDI